MTNNQIPIINKCLTCFSDLIKEELVAWFLLNHKYDRRSSHKFQPWKRTFLFARAVRDYVTKLPGNITNQEIGRQLIRSAGSVGANYIEANEALSKKDFLFRIKICRKEVKESCYWNLQSIYPVRSGSRRNPG